MSKSSRQDEDNPIETLASLEVLEEVELTVYDETVVGRSISKVVEDDRILVVVSEEGGDREFRIETQWAHGWLDPLVDVIDTSDSDPEFRPQGSLKAVEQLT